MKNLITHRFFVAITLATAVVACWGNAHAQVSIETIVGDISKESIIRMLKPDAGIEYKHDGTTGSFNFVDFSNMTEKRTSIPANLNILVSDFEIYNGDIVFFCGSMNTGTLSGCIGWFSVNDLINGTGVVSFKPYPSCEKFLKMDVFSTVANEVHIVATAELNDPQYSYPIRGVYDAIFDIAAWNINIAYYNYQGGSVDYFEDIVCTNHFVATVEQKYTGNAEYTRVYAMPTTAGGDIFTAAPPSDIYSNVGGGDFIPENRERFITRMVGDYYATACYVKHNTDYGLGISIYQATNLGPNFVNRIFVLLGSTFDPNWELKDFTYNDNQKKFYILHNTNTTPYVSDIIEINYPGGFVGGNYKRATSNVLWSLSNNMLMNEEISSGFRSTTNEPFYVRMGAAPINTCLPRFQLTLSTVYEQNRTAFGDRHPYSENYPANGFLINTTVYNITNTCQ